MVIAAQLVLELRAQHILELVCKVLTWTVFLTEERRMDSLEYAQARFADADSETVCHFIEV